MATIYIENMPYEVEDGQNLLKACLGLGFNIPYFCWHPAMGSVGACRLCAVKQFRDENDKAGRIVMSCMTAATNGTRISIEDAEVRAFRKRVIEYLMVNHPHDCPVCDEGGECHLQDMTLMTGHAYRRFRFKKRTYQNQYLGPLINHEMNRCIQCYRCVRFYRDYAGGDDLDVFGVHDMVYFGRSEDGVLESEFAGNLAEVCPTGVFTDKTLKQHYTRKWDLQNAPSVCHHCSLGCNIIASERYGSLRRIQSRYNSEVNGYFICDRGRFGYEHVNAENRLKTPMVRLGDGLQAASSEQAIEKARDLIAKAGRVIGIGSPRASLEANYALLKLVGQDNFVAGIPQRELDLVHELLRLLRETPAHTPSLREIERYDAVFVLGEDVTNTAPMMDLALRQAAKMQPRRYAAKLKIPEWDDYSVKYAVQGLKGPFFVATPCSTKLDSAATLIHRAAPQDLAALGYAVAEAIAGNTNGGTGASIAQAIARDLLAAQQPVIVSGPSLGSAAIMQAAAAVAAALRAKGVEASLALTAPECNSMGLGLLAQRGFDEAISSAGSQDVLVIIDNDLTRRLAPEQVQRLCGSGCAMIVIDHYLHALAAQADVVLPSGAFAESDGTLVNNEGRAQRFYQAYVPQGEIQESWRWLRDVAQGRSAEAWATLDDVIASMVEDHPQFRSIAQTAPSSDFRIAGQKIPRRPHRYSGRTAMHANISVHEARPPDDPDSPLGFTMEGYQGKPPGPIVPFFWSPGWNSQQAINKFQAEIAGPLIGGDSGTLLLTKESVGTKSPVAEKSVAFQPRSGEWQLVPVHHIFGSEELSRLSPPIAELSPKPALFLNAQDAATAGLADGGMVSLNVNGRQVRLTMIVRGELPAGVAGYSAGYEETAGIVPLEWARIEKVAP